MIKADTSPSNPISFLLESRRAEIISLKFFYRIGDLVLIISNIVHSLQRERGASNMFIGSNGTHFKKELTQLIIESDETVAIFHAFLEQYYHELIGQQGKSLWLNQIGTSLYQLESLSEIREQTYSLKIHPQEIVEFYTHVIAGLMDLVFETVDIVAEPKTANTLITLFHLMHSKEYIGQERAIGSAGFAKGHFSEPLQERHAQVVESQKQSFKLFSHFAEIDILGSWQSIEHATTVAKINTFRALILSNTDFDPQISTEWFTNITRWIDKLKDIEIKLQLQFKIQIEQLIQSAEGSLQSNKNELDRIQRNAKPSDSFSVTVQAHGTADAFQAAGVGKKMNQQLFQMMQEQAYRLQESNQALQEAKDSLLKQKNINRAKGLLSKHHKLSEDESHNYLRKLAMNHNKKIEDIAIFVIDQFQHIGR